MTASDITWGGAWLELIEGPDSGFAAADLERGRSYAQHDWRFDVDLEPGEASALARSGPRLTYRAVVAAPPLDDDGWARLLRLIADSSARTAALLDRELDIELLREAQAAGIEIFPSPRSLRVSCECRSEVAPCRHAAAVLYVLADAFDEDPFDLLLFRGKEASEVFASVGGIRAGDDAEPGGDGESASEPAAENRANSVVDDELPRSNMMSAVTAWKRTPGPIPEPLVMPDAAPNNVDFGAGPPRSAPFTARGLGILATEAAGRAFAMISDGASSSLDLSRPLDLARRAAAAENTDGWAGIVAASPHSGQAMRQRAQAWRLAGAAGVNVLDNVAETQKVSDDVQFRQGTSGDWFRFEKVSGRWTMVAGPLDAPDAESEAGSSDAQPQDAESADKAE